LSAHGHHPATALAWIREDLDRILGQLRSQLEHLGSAKGVSDEAILKVANQLDDLRLTCHMLKLSGAAMLADDMTLLARHLGEHRTSDHGRGFEALMDAIVVLPAYLDRLQAGHHDLPLLLMPAINRLRLAYRGRELQESALFTPDLEVELPELDAITSSEEVSKEPLAECADRLRLQYETALLNWLNEQDSVDLLSPLQGVCETLLHRLERTDLKRCWWIAAEVLSGLGEKKIQNDTHMRRLLARLHLNLKALAEGGESGVTVESSESLSRALLYRAAHAKPGHNGLHLLKTRFKLKELVLEPTEVVRARGAVSGKDREMYQALNAAIQDELSLIQDALDLELRTGTVEPDRRAQCNEALIRLQDTLQMLGLASSAETIERLMPEFEASAAAAGEQLESALMALAKGLLKVEAAVREQVETLGESGSEQDSDTRDGLTPHEYQKIVHHLLNEIVRSVHWFQDALKARFDGSREADIATPIMEIAGALELLGNTDIARQARRLEELNTSLLGEVFSETALPGEQLDRYTDAVAALELHLAAVRDQQEQQDRFAAVLRERLDQLESTQAPGTGAEQQDESGEPAAEEAAPASPAGPETPAEAGEPGRAEPSISTAAVVIDPELLEIFLEEYEDVSENLQQQLPKWISQLNDAGSLAEVRRCFHTLKGSGRMVGAFELGDFCWQIEEMLNALLEARITAFADTAVIVRLAQATLPALKQRLMNQASGLTHATIEVIGKQADALSRGGDADWDELRQQLPGFLASMLPEPRSQPKSAPSPPQDTDEDVHAAMRDELYENLLVVETLLDSVSLDRNTLASAEHVRAAHTIAGALALSPQGQDVGIARALEDALETQRNRNTPFNNEALWALGSCFAFMQARLEQLEGDPDAEYPEDEEGVLGGLIKLKEWFESAEPMAAEPTEAVEAEESPTQPGPAEAEPDAGTPAPPTETADAEEESFQDEITQIFLEEAREVLGRCDSLLNTWRDNLHTMPLVQNLQREIHTLKGGARMAGLTALGNLSHAMEELLERTANHEIQPMVASVEALEQGCDRLHAWVEQISRGQTPDPGTALETFLQKIEGLSGEPGDLVLPGATLPEAEPRVLTDIPEFDAPAPGKTEEATGNNQIRVDADLLDHLVKSAGEINIFRARLERQIDSLRGNLGEFNETIGRLREQFRKLEIETETQIRSRYRDAATEDDEAFDPLELDRFSSMQQLSRGLSESVADLLNLEELLEDSARQADHLLGQQSRVSTELQEGLMQTRMVPFGSIAPRLRRLARKAASETGKKARLQLLMAGSSDQLDRNVLEHITAPLEHMIRNAIAHGIEEPAVRKSLKKDPEGEIRVTVESEATEFVIQVEDDGAGINRDAIRQRAIERGLIDEDSDPPPQQLFDLILGSGFSTSTTVTGLAGRGVGMDVVSSEIKQIGGSLEIRSEEGQGSCFIIRIPFTLAVMQAIGVVAGEQRYFIPLTSVAGVARIEPEAYASLLQQDQPIFTYGDEDYPVLELEPLLGEPARPLGSSNVSLLMIKAGEQQAAFRVPELFGHREVVIKPVGPQITSVPGILGGTVTGDGRVVIILDPGPIIRQARLHGVRPVITEQQVQVTPSRTTAMVVDDSITMRKVNSRVLESQGIEAITAKDGQDAAEQLKDRVPDILLLDIEMPRMDGYQLAEHVRGDARLREIPIIMITSRSGQKHRDRAMQAGANAYLTKPYKESDLIETVRGLLDLQEEE
jgi:chemosensory pili system protein ChpA (sensor histidine kinase/response regulator)